MNTLNFLGKRMAAAAMLRLRAIIAVLSGVLLSASPCLAATVTLSSVTDTATTVTLNSPSATTADFYVFGTGDRKSGGGSVFSAVSSDATISSATDSAIGIAWTGGTPAASSAGTPNFKYAQFGSGYSPRATYAQFTLTTPFAGNGTLEFWLRPNGNTASISYDVTVGGVTNSYTGTYEGDLQYFTYAISGATVSDVITVRVDNVSGGNSWHNVGFNAAQLTLPEPATPSSGLNFTSVTANSMTAEWIRGNGSDCIVLMRPGSAVNSDPVDGATYTANAAFGTGSQIGAGNYVVYKGTGTSVAVTALTSGTIYHVAVYEFNGSGSDGFENYLLTSPATGSAATFADEPTSQVSGVALTPVTTTSMTVSWINPVSGGGANRIVLMQSGSAVDSYPADAADYTADANFGGAGSAIGSAKVVYVGSGTSVSVTGLTSGTTYHVAIYDFNGAAGTENYLTLSPATTSNMPFYVPQITGQSPHPLSTPEDTPLTVGFGNLAVSDLDDSYPTGFSLTVLGGSNYTVSGTVISPYPNYSGSLTVPVKVNDGGLDSDIYNLAVTVIPVNDAPTISAIPDQTVNEDIAAPAVVFTVGDAEISAELLAVSGTSSNTALVPDGNIVFGGSGANRTLVITPAPNQNGSADITVTVSNGSLTGSASFKLTVNPVDDAPVPVTDGIPAVKAVTGDAPKTLNLTEFFTDADNDISAMTFAATSSNAPLIGASVSGNVLTLTFPADNFGESLITVTAASGGKTASCEFAAAVNPKGYKVSGKVSYFSNGLAVSGVEMTLTGTNYYTGKTETYTAETGADGTYLFPDAVRGEYTLAPSKPEAPVPANLTAADGSEIADAALGLKVLTPIQFKAADVTGNGRISGLDASRVTRFATGLLDEMSNTGTPAPAWQFEPASVTVSLNADTADLNFAAALTGDVSGNYRPGTSVKTARDATDTALLKVRQGEMLSVPLVLTQETFIRGIDVRIEYDADMLTLSDLSLSGGILENENYEFVSNPNEPGVIRIAIFSLSSLTAVTGSGTVMTADFTVTGPKEFSVLRLERFDCNEIPVSASVPRSSSEPEEIITGGFEFDGSVFGGAAIRTEIDYDVNLYDLTGDGRIGLEDAVQALLEGDLKTAIRALQCVTGM